MAKNSGDFLCDPTKYLSSWGPYLGNFSRISEESVTGNDSREIPWKFLKESHHGWRICGNSSLLLLGLYYFTIKSSFFSEWERSDTDDKLWNNHKMAWCFSHVGSRRNVLNMFFFLYFLEILFLKKKLEYKIF